MSTDFRFIMKIKSVYIFLFLAFVIGLDYLGVYQFGEVHVNEITISKPMGYKYSSVSSTDENTLFNSFMNTNGLIKKYELTDNSILNLTYKQVLLENKMNIFFSPLTNFDKKLLIEAKNEACTGLKIKMEDNQYMSNSVIYKSSININFISNNPDLIKYFYNQICN